MTTVAAASEKLVIQDLEAQSTTVRVRTINVTSAGSNQTSILLQSADLLAIQEHCVDEGAAARFRAAAKLKNWLCFIGPVDPEHTRKSAGVGFLAREGINLTPIIAKTDYFVYAVHTGRAMIMQLEHTQRLHLLC